VNRYSVFGNWKLLDDLCESSEIGKTFARHQAAISTKMYFAVEKPSDTCFSPNCRQSV
jgi:hypothetical protein